MAITIKQIAALAGVSPATVSLVLNNKPSRVSQETRLRVKEIAQQHNYTVNSMARYLVTKQSNLLGLLISANEHLSFSTLSTCFSTELQKKNYYMMLAYSNNSFREDLERIQDFVNYGVGGMFLILSDESLVPENFYQIQTLIESANIPYVLIDRVPKNIKCNKVWIDNEYAGYLAGQTFIQKGHEKIGCVHYTKSQNGQARLRGFCHALEDAGHIITPELFIEATPTLQGGYHSGNLYIPDNVTALFTTHDFIAYGLVISFRERGINLKNAIELISFRNFFFVTFDSIDFHAVGRDLQSIVEYSVELLIHHLIDPQAKVAAISLEPYLYPISY